ncbi:UNKNOWN [Stylonychia lemnae]|uniref:Uncharacterized protein n=1 Tax=Stylonychia lemnae TaxID=5949 RepID=A0A077ZY31_STYLE|nr:UNKNOWN [Stylonychia lemnae]|eukprot:CDW74811.1 UNKNOWN [Stylonychia lemnae]
MQNQINFFKEKQKSFYEDYFRRYRIPTSQLIYAQFHPTMNQMEQNLSMSEDNYSKSDLNNQKVDNKIYLITLEKQNIPQGMQVSELSTDPEQIKHEDFYQNKPGTTTNKRGISSNAQSQAVEEKINKKYNINESYIIFEEDEAKQGDEQDGGSKIFLRSAVISAHKTLKDDYHKIFFKHVDFEKLKDQEQVPVQYISNIGKSMLQNLSKEVMLHQNSQILGASTIRFVHEQSMIERFNHPLFEQTQDMFEIHRVVGDDEVSVYTFSMIAFDNKFQNRKVIYQQQLTFQEKRTIFKNKFEFSQDMKSIFFVTVNDDGLLAEIIILNSKTLEQTSFDTINLSQLKFDDTLKTREKVSLLETRKQYSKQITRNFSKKIIQVQSNEFMENNGHVSVMITLAVLNQNIQSKNHIKLYQYLLSDLINHYLNNASMNPKLYLQLKASINLQKRPICTNTFNIFANEGQNELYVSVKNENRKRTDFEMEGIILTRIQLESFQNTVDKFESISLENQLILNKSQKLLGGSRFLMFDQDQNYVFVQEFEDLQKNLQRTEVQTEQQQEEQENELTQGILLKDTQHQNIVDALYDETVECLIIKTQYIVTTLSYLQFRKKIQVSQFKAYIFQTISNSQTSIKKTFRIQKLEVIMFLKLLSINRLDYNKLVLDNAVENLMTFCDNINQDSQISKYLMFSQKLDKKTVGINLVKFESDDEANICHTLEIKNQIIKMNAFGSFLYILDDQGIILTYQNQEDQLVKIKEDKIIEEFKNSLELINYDEQQILITDNTVFIGCFFYQRIESSYLKDQENDFESQRQKIIDDTCFKDFYVGPKLSSGKKKQYKKFYFNQSRSKEQAQSSRDQEVC